MCEQIKRGVSANEDRFAQIGAMVRRREDRLKVKREGK